MRKQFLDGIRGWAAVMVLLSHLIHNFAAQAGPALNKNTLLFPTDGTIAVYLFFVVSGFALSTRFIESHSLSGITSLAIRRYPRLFIPIAAATAVSFVVWKAGLVYSHQAAVLANTTWWLGKSYNFTPSVWGALRFVTFDVFFSYDERTSYNSALWTMSIELYGSMLVFGLLAVFAPTRRAPVYLFAFAVLFLLNSPLLAFLLGMLVAEYDHSWAKIIRGKRNVSLMFAFVGIAGLWTFSTFGRNWYNEPRVLALVAFIFVAAVASCQNTIGFFSSWLSRILGKLSFPLYLTHMVVICSLSSYAYVHWLSKGMSPQAASNLMVAITLPAVFLFAWIFYPIETLAVNVSHRLSSRINIRDDAARGFTAQERSARPTEKQIEAHASPKRKSTKENRVA